MPWTTLLIVLTVSRTPIHMCNAHFLYFRTSASDFLSNREYYRPRNHQFKSTGETLGNAEDFGEIRPF